MFRLARAFLGLTLLFGAFAAHGSEEVHVYSARQENLIKPILDRFSEETGVKVRLVTGDADALLQRLKSEGRNSPADLLITTDAGRLHRALESGVLQAVQSKTLDQSIPAAYRHPEGYWFGLSLRARPVMYAPDRVKPEDLSDYESLSDGRWKNRICVRSSGSIYNQSLVASMLASRDAEQVESWAKGFVANFARPPAGGDRSQIEAVAAGECDIAIANTYYLAGMLASGTEKEKEAASKVSVFWPNQSGRGAHVNISGAGVTAHAPNRAQAIDLLEFLVSDEAQNWYAEANHEYPVKADIAMSETLSRFGEFKADTVNLSVLGENNAQAVRIMDRAGWR